MTIQELVRFCDDHDFYYSLDYDPLQGFDLELWSRSREWHRQIRRQNTLEGAAQELVAQARLELDFKEPDQ